MAYQLTAQDRAEIEKQLSNSGISVWDGNRYYDMKAQYEPQYIQRGEAKILADNLPFNTITKILIWLDSQPKYSGAVGDRATWDSRYQSLNKAIAIITDYQNRASAFFLSQKVEDQAYLLTQTGGNIGVGYHGTSLNLFLASLSSQDVMILNEMERQRKAGDDYWGGNFLSSQGLMDALDFGVKAAAVAIVVTGTLGAGTGVLAAGSATEAGTLAGSTGLLSGTGAAATGAGSAGVLTSAGLGTGAAVSTGALATGGSGLVATLLAATSDTALDAALSFVTTQIAPKNAPAKSGAVGTGAAPQTLNSKIIAAAIAAASIGLLLI